jgi:Zn-dependent membrane protease YugP
VTETFTRYRGVPNRATVSGAELARRLLDAHGLGDVKVELAPGALTDHYDGGARALRLSQEVGAERSVAAMGIAAHEIGHAYQDAEGSRAYRIRKAIGEPLSALAPWSALIFIGGFWFGSELLMALSIAYVAGLALFALVTLPVELGASRRAVELLRSTRLADAEELEEVRAVLRAAATTYIVGLLRQIGFFLALVLIAMATHEVTT